MSDGSSPQLWREVGEDWVCFDTETNETRLVSSLAQFLYTFLTQQSAPVALVNLIDVVKIEDPSGGVEESQVEIEQTLDQLVKFGLVVELAIAS